MTERACANIDRAAISGLKSKRALQSQELEEAKKRQQLEKKEESEELEEKEEGWKCEEVQSVTTALSIGKAEIASPKDEHEKSCSILGKIEEDTRSDGGQVGDADYFTGDEGGLVRVISRGSYERGGAGFSVFVGGKSDENIVGDFEGGDLRGGSNHHGNALNNPKRGLFERGGAECNGSGGGPGGFVNIKSGSRQGWSVKNACGATEYGGDGKGSASKLSSGGGKGGKEVSGSGSGGGPGRSIRLDVRGSAIVEGGLVGGNFEFFKGGSFVKKPDKSAKDSLTGNFEWGHVGGSGPHGGSGGGGIGDEPTARGGWNEAESANSGSDAAWLGGRPGFFSRKTFGSGPGGLLGSNSGGGQGCLMKGGAYGGAENGGGGYVDEKTRVRSGGREGEGKIVGCVVFNFQLYGGGETWRWLPGGFLKFPKEVCRRSLAKSFVGLFWELILEIECSKGSFVIVPTDKITKEMRLVTRAGRIMFWFV